MADIDVILGLESILLGLAVYLCCTQWIYFIRKHVCRNCGINRSFIQNILLAASCTLLVVSAAMEMIFLAYINKCIIVSDMSDASTISPKKHCSGSDVQESLANGILLVCVIVLFAIYGVIWIRQRSIYRIPFLDHLTTNITRFISKYFIIYGALMALLILCWFIVDPFVGIPLAFILMLFPLSFQLPLLILSIYPLIKAIHFNRTSTIKTDRKYVQLLKRVTILSAICIASDMTMAVSFLDPSSAVRFSLCHLDLIVNLICVNLISSDWKSRLVPWIRLCRRNQCSREVPLMQRATPLPTATPRIQAPNTIADFMQDVKKMSVFRH